MPYGPFETERRRAAMTLLGDGDSLASPRRTLVQRDGLTYERLKRLLVEIVALPDVDGAPHASFEAGIEQLRGIRQRSALGKGDLHVRLVRLAGADKAIV